MNLSSHNNLTTKTLKNGFTIILNEDHRLPKVFGLVVTKAGGKDDPANATGMAHYMEHMLFKGTTKLGTLDWEKEKPHIDNIFKLYDLLSATKDEEKRKEIQTQINKESLEAAQYGILNEMSNLVYRMGGTKLNAFTSPDITVFFNEFPPNQINRWIDLYSHRFQEPVFRAFQAELEVVYEEKNMYEDQFQTKLIESFNRYMFKKHPYGQRSLIGTKEDLKNPSLTKMYEFFKTWYVANNMALVLSGDFNTDEVMPMIEEKFGQLKSAKLLERTKYIEEPFKGREVYSEKLSPIKMNLMGFRVPADGEEEKPVMDLICKMLNNSTQTGYLDQLSLDNKLLAAVAMQIPYHDYGSLIVMAIPKLIGQSHESAENLAIEQMQRIAKGDFTETFLEIIKNEFYSEEQQKLESLQEKSLALAFAFTKGLDLNTIFNRAEIIKKITSDDVKKVASKYFGDNYLVLQSKMGKPSVDKIDKPGYKPIMSNSQEVSEYQKHFNTIKPKELDYKPIDFLKDIQEREVYKNYKVFRTANNVNDIFTLQILFCVGTEKIKRLDLATSYMNLTGTKEFDSNQLKLEFAKLGATYIFDVNDSYTSINVVGIEKNLPKILQLLNKLINEPLADNSKISTIYENEKANREIERKEPDNVANALLHYALYNKKSKYIDRDKLSDIKKLKATHLIEVFKSATQYAIEIFFAGNTDIGELCEHARNNFNFSENLKDTDSPIYKPTVTYPENTLFFTNKKKAKQAKIFFTTKSELSKQEYAMLNAFNVYIGGGFSGLLAQEIREYRSMAYAVGGSFKIPKKQNDPVHFTAYVGTQSDKANEAIEILNSIIRDMPQKPERIEMIKEYLISKVLTDKPDFRNLIPEVKKWKNQGYETDPFNELTEYYKNLTWDKLYEFYNRMLKNNKFAIVVVGDKSRVSIKQLNKYGKVKEISENKLFTK